MSASSPWKPCDFTRGELAEHLKEANYDVSTPAYKAYFFKVTSVEELPFVFRKLPNTNELCDGRARCQACGFMISEHSSGGGPQPAPTSRSLEDILQSRTETSSCKGFTYRLIGGSSIVDEDVVDRSDKEVSVINSMGTCTWSTFEFIPVSKDKGDVAALVSGESGSGKTFFSSFLIQKKLQQWGASSFFRMCLTSDSTGDIGASMNRLSSPSISKDERDELAVSTMESLFKYFVGEPFVGKVEKLVLIVDEISSCLNLAKGCIAAAVRRANEDRPLFSFAKKTFFVFCGTSVELTVPDIAAPAGETHEQQQLEDPGSGRATTKLRRSTTHPNRIVTIHLRQADDAFYESCFGSEFDQRRHHSSVFRALRTNCRAGCIAYHYLTKNKNASITDLLTHVAKQYGNSNGIGSLRNKSGNDELRRRIRGALRAVLQTSVLADDEIEELCSLGLIAKEYRNDTFVMSLALLLMCLCEFGISTVPALDWDSFEHLCFSYEHLLAMAHAKKDSGSVTTMQLTTPFPQAAAGAVSVPKRLYDAMEKLRPGDSLIVLNGERAPFADIFSILVDDDGTVELRLVQCKYYGPSSKLRPAQYTEELLKWSLRSAKEMMAPTSLAHQVALSFPDNLIGDDDVFTDAAIRSRAAIETIRSVSSKQNAPLRIRPLFYMKDCSRASDACKNDLSLRPLDFKEKEPCTAWEVDKVEFNDQFGPLTEMVEKNCGNKDEEEKVRGCRLRWKRKKTESGPDVWASFSDEGEK